MTSHAPRDEAIPTVPRDETVERFGRVGAELQRKGQSKKALCCLNRALDTVRHAKVDEQPFLVLDRVRTQLAVCGVLSSLKRHSDAFLEVTKALDDAEALQALQFPPPGVIDEVESCIKMARHCLALESEFLDADEEVKKGLWQECVDAGMPPEQVPPPSSAPSTMLMSSPPRSAPWPTNESCSTGPTERPSTTASQPVLTASQSLTGSASQPVFVPRFGRVSAQNPRTSISSGVRGLREVTKKLGQHGVDRSERPQTVDGAAHYGAAEATLKIAYKRYQSLEAVRLRQQALQVESLDKAIGKFKGLTGFKARAAQRRTAADMGSQKLEKGKKEGKQNEEKTEKEEGTEDELSRPGPSAVESKKPALFLDNENDEEDKKDEEKAGKKEDEGAASAETSKYDSWSGKTSFFDDLSRKVAEESRQNSKEENEDEHDEGESRKASNEVDESQRVMRVSITNTDIAQGVQKRASVVGNAPDLSELVERPETPDEEPDWALMKKRLTEHRKTKDTVDAATMVARWLTGQGNTLKEAEETKKKQTLKPGEEPSFENPFKQNAVQDDGEKFANAKRRTVSRGSVTGETILFDSGQKKEDAETPRGRAREEKLRRQRRKMQQNSNPFLQWKEAEKERKNVHHFDHDTTLQSFQSNFRHEQKLLRQDVSSRDSDWLYENRVFYGATGYRLGYEKGMKAKEAKLKEMEKTRKELRRASLQMSQHVKRMSVQAAEMDSRPETQEGLKRAPSAPSSLDRDVAGSEFLDGLKQELNRSCFGVLSQVDDTITKVKKQDNEWKGLLGERFKNVTSLNEKIRTEQKKESISEQQRKGGLERLLQKKFSEIGETGEEEKAATYVDKKRLSRLSISHLDRVFDGKFGAFM